MTLEAGETLLHYRIVEKIGEGGMGVVYVAEDSKLRRQVALKVLPPEVAGDSDRRARFEREARAVAALNHSNIVTLYSIEEAPLADSSHVVHFITMELVPGVSLDHALPENGMALESFLAIALPLTEALARAHAQGIVHRDIKSANIMLSDEGAPKILDFGLARMDQDPGEDSEASHSPTMTMAQAATRPGAVLGTPAYMAPEQVQGKPADTRSDVFSLGAVFYEMLTGRRPFQRSSGIASMAALLNEEPESLHHVRPDVPRDLESILQRCLAKEPDKRFPSAAELHAELLLCQSRHVTKTVGLSTMLRRPRLAIPALLVLVGIVACASWWAVRSSGMKKMRTQAMPQIENLLEDGHHFDAFRLAYDVRQKLPGDPTAEKLFLSSTIPVTITTDPAGANVEIRSYRDLEGEWFDLGPSPIDDRLPGGYLRFRIAREGYEPVVAAFSSWWGSLHFELVAEGVAPPGMLRIPAGQVSSGRGEPIELEAYWIDRFEVTNGQYQEFVDDGGYTTSAYWKVPFEDEGREVPFEEAMARFVDAMGRPGPATWNLGRYPEGEEDYPVHGVSWYEAAAYAQWAGKSLPTVHHWRQAAGQGIFADILTVSNFDGVGPAQVGQYQGLGPYGSYDMAGNVTEWCWNRVDDLRYALGGSWSDPPYRFPEDNALTPFDRSPNLGFRCVRYDDPPSHEAVSAIAATRFDFSKIEPMSDDLFALVAERYEYEDVELEAHVESAGLHSPHWRLESVSFNTAYDGERMLAHVFLPTNAEPPFQTVVFRPGAAVNWLPRIEDFLSFLPGYIPRTGRAVVVPALWGTLERRGDGRRGKDRLLRQAQDLWQTLDYLETRPDIDVDRLAYMGLSAGAEYGPVYVAGEDRFKAAVFIAGGFHDEHMLEEPRDQVPWHFAPRVLVPTLMINGDNDFTLPPKLAQIPMFELLGTDARDKRHVLLAGGHIPFDQNAVIRETLDWLDRYLGSVEIRNPSLDL